MDMSETNSRVVAAYRARTPGSEALAREAAALLPSGITHDARHLEPYGIYIERAAGPRKWDVDGNEYVDYFGGHGALLLGHNHPVVTEAVQSALAHGHAFRGESSDRDTLGGSHKAAGAVSGADTVHLIGDRGHADGGAPGAGVHRAGNADLRFKGHFHGWHDHMTFGYSDVILTDRRPLGWCRGSRTR